MIGNDIFITANCAVVDTTHGLRRHPKGCHGRGSLIENDNPRVCKSLQYRERRADRRVGRGNFGEAQATTDAYG